MPALNITLETLAYSDPANASSPTRKAFDWQRSLLNIPCANPAIRTLTVPGSATSTIFSLVETTSIDVTTQFNVTLNPLNDNIYRFTWNGTGTAPVFRVPRAIAVATYAITVTVLANVSANFSVAAGGLWTGVVVGDIVFIPGVSTGDTPGPFNTLNEGYWSVAGILSSTVLNLVRLPYVVFSGQSETVTPGLASQIIAFSSTGIQLGDSVQITAGFSLVTQGTYIIGNVTPTWFEISSSTPIPLETGIAPSTGIQFFTGSKRWVRLEADQNVVIRLNADTGSFNQIQPLTGDINNAIGWFEIWGPVFELVVVNKATVPTNLAVFSVE